MELLLDTANIQEIKELYDCLVIDGVTTNPTILAKDKVKLENKVKEITAITTEHTPLHVQIISQDFQEIIKEALYIHSLRNNIYVKIPVTKDGLKAIKELKKLGVKVTATAIFTATQGFLAAKAGADYVAPYVNRIDNISGDGVAVVTQLTQILNQYHLPTKVLAASFKNVQQIYDIMKIGVHSITISSDMCKAMYQHPSTDVSILQFYRDWEEAFGITSLK